MRYFSGAEKPTGIHDYQSVVTFLKQPSNREVLNNEGLWRTPITETDFTNALYQSQKDEHNNKLMKNRK